MFVVEMAAIFNQLSPQLPVEIIHGHALLLRLDIPSHAPLLDWIQRPSLSDDLLVFPFYQSLHLSAARSFHLTNIIVPKSSNIEYLTTGFDCAAYYSTLNTNGHEDGTVGLRDPGRPHPEA